MKIRLLSGFTLVELMVVIVIVGVLASLAIPKFSRAQHRSKISEFPTILTQIYTAENTYEMEYGSYISAGDGQTNNWSSVGLVIPTSKYFSYSAVESNNGSKMVATATANQTIGDVINGSAATINQDGARNMDAVFQIYTPAWKP